MPNIDTLICTYIYHHWIAQAVSQRGFALDHNIEESIVRKIKNTALQTAKSRYNIPVSTLQKICEARNLPLQEFFSLIDC
ncbi:transcriptional regulator [Flavobacterium sp. JP2137]|uniref:transcriptional regulator n=1 Tax=Flavobacterium sp. JP2137 TaxID=3414510 RepID=UPI003D2FC80E